MAAPAICVSRSSKEAVGNTVSQLYQSNWSGRAETGLIGDDDFHVKVSADGTTWREALIVDRSTGRVAFPSGIGDGAPRGVSQPPAQCAVSRSISAASRER